MKDRVLIYKPRTRGPFERSPLYVLPMVAKSAALCLKYLLHCLKNSVNVKSTDEYISLFWQEHFEATSSSLYVTGQGMIDKEETYIFMSNHESWMDIPAMFGAVPGSLRMISKAGLMQVPFLGQAMRNAGFIAVDRRNRKKAIGQLEEAKKRLREGISIWIAPEGTRTRSGQIGGFKKGGFYLAKQLNQAIVPVFIEGAAMVMPADSIMIQANRDITVHFCKPIRSEEVRELEIDSLMDKVRSQIIEKQQDIKKSKGRINK